jgi:hypothetical protein
MAMCRQGLTIAVKASPGSSRHAACHSRLSSLKPGGNRRQRPLFTSLGVISDLHPKQ